MTIVMLVSLILNLVGVVLTVSSKIRSTNYRIDGGNFSDPNSGFIEIELGWKYKAGWIALCAGVCLQMIITTYKVIPLAS